MSGVARIQMQHFQMARLAAPSAVLFAQMQVSGSPVAPRLLKNPTLLLRALDALHSTTAQPAATPLAERLEQVDQDWLDNLIRRSALHLALLDTPLNHPFLIRHWLVSRRLALTTAALAQATAYADTTGAACCGLLLRAGMLVLEQQQSASYAVLTAGAWEQSALLASERELFQLDHVEAGVRLLESWELDQFSIDALRYQALPSEQVLDAAPLVKLCWYANALTTNASPALLGTGRELLGLAAEQIQALLERVQLDLDNECTALGLPALREPVPAATVRDLAQEAQQKLQLLRQEISTDNMLARHAVGSSENGASLQTRLAHVLQDAGIEPIFIVLGSASARHTLEVRTSNRVQPDPAGLRIVCAAGRNALSTLILQGDAGVLANATPGLAVIDRQLLALLGGQSLVCEAVVAGDKVGVLLLGVQPGAVSVYLGQHALRRFIRRVLQDTAQTREGVPVSTLLLQQRVREAVHEANNPLAIIKNYLYILGIKQGNAGAASDEIQLIRAEIDRVAAILAQLREAETTTSPPQKLNLDTLVTTMHKMFAVAWQDDGKHINITLQLGAGAACVFASASALKQILTNLVKNAAEAIDTTGSITLSTKANIYLRDQFFVQLSVTDNGPGIAPDMMTRLFKPGTTATSTKGGAHTGSGLGIVRRLVEEMGGQISCHSESKSDGNAEGKGTAIDILLPMA